MSPFTWATTDAVTAAERAAAGAAFLDRRLGPGWEARINPERLDIGSPFNCILGQLGWTGLWLQLTFGEVKLAVDYGFSSGPLADLVWLVYRSRKLRRSFELLTEAWRELLAERARQRAEAEARARAEEEGPVIVAVRERAPAERLAA
jgi:hypothetical protein